MCDYVNNRQEKEKKRRRASAGKLNLKEEERIRGNPRQEADFLGLAPVHPSLHGEGGDCLKV